MRERIATFLSLNGPPWPPRAPKIVKKSPGDLPKTAQDPPRGAQEGPKTLPRPLQEAIYVATRERMEPFLSLNGPSWPPRAPKSPPRPLQDQFFIDFFNILDPKIISQSSFSSTFSPSHQRPRPTNTAQTKQDRTAQPNTAQHHHPHHSTHANTPNSRQNNGDPPTQLL